MKEFKGRYKMNTNMLYSYLESYTCYNFTLLHKFVAYDVSLCMNVCCQQDHLSASNYSTAFTKVANNQKVKDSYKVNTFSSYLSSCTFYTFT